VGSRHVVDWPADGQMSGEGVAAQGARLLAGGETLPGDVSSGALVISVPEEAPDEAATVIALR